MRLRHLVRARPPLRARARRRRREGGGRRPRLDRLEALAARSAPPAASPSPAARRHRRRPAARRGRTGRGEAGRRDDPGANNAGIPDAQRAHKMSVEFIDQGDGHQRARAVDVLLVRVRAPADGGREDPGASSNVASMAAFQYGGHGAACAPRPRWRWCPHGQKRGAGGGVGAQRHRRERDRPGAFSSEMMDVSRAWATSRRAFRAHGPSRTGDPATTAPCSTCRPASDFVTGTTIRVDDVQGGR